MDNTTTVTALETALNTNSPVRESYVVNLDGESYHVLATLQSVDGSSVARVSEMWFLVNDFSGNATCVAQAILQEVC